MTETKYAPGDSVGVLGDPVENGAWLVVRFFEGIGTYELSGDFGIKLIVLPQQIVGSRDSDEEGEW